MNIIEMAKQAGLDWARGWTLDDEPNRFEAFAALVAAQEREACATICDVLSVHPEYASETTLVAAMAIRTRGKHESVFGVESSSVLRVLQAPSVDNHK